jgi:alpha-D-ribose 1-methylphosphonate 5-triphosphate diphosphatase PhnM
MITVAELKGLAANKALSIGEAWNALDAAAERLEFIESFLTATAERMRLEAYVHTRTDPRHAATLEAFAKDVATGIANNYH